MVKTNPGEKSHLSTATVDDVGVTLRFSTDASVVGAGKIIHHHHHHIRYNNRYLTIVIHYMTIRLSTQKFTRLSK